MKKKTLAKKEVISQNSKIAFKKQKFKPLSKETFEYLMKKIAAI